MIVEAAQAASAAFETHWLRHWLMAHNSRIARVKTQWGRSAAHAGLFGDIETIIKEIGPK